MNTDLFELKSGCWYGWIEAPSHASRWPVGPILLTEIKPLKIGNGLLELTLIKPVNPGGAVRTNLVLQVTQREADHLVARWSTNGRSVAVVICEVTLDWMGSYCGEHLRRRPVEGPQLIIEGQAPMEPSAEEHFMRVFGASPEAVLAGATPTSFPANEPTLPSQCENFDLNRTYDELDSWFIGRGFTPTAMEEKWFIYLAEGVLTFRRSWTGIVIYEVEAEWRGAQLRLSRARVNRDPSQYGETDTAFDHHLLLYIIDVVLLGKEAIFPTKPALEPDGSALQAWSIVGKASL
ncbi:hypothetical protein [Brevundimonas nasdae]|uniref:hypothetical protein n=1 Tax=Brevundimonas nasdae TaxID=172043 RepID=UPI0006911B82|nr:hypothetical protein [Brevundimonas nasdae]